MKKVKELIAHPLVSGSSIVFVGSFIANVLAYLFNLAMGRMLPVGEYGLLSALSSLFILLAIFQSAFSNVFTKFTARFEVAHDLHGEKVLFYKGVKYVTIFSIGLVILLFIFINPISSFLHVDQKILLVLLFFTIFFNMLSSVPLGILTGQMKFTALAIMNNFGPVVKLGIAIVLVYIGWHILGAVTGLMMGALTGFFIFYIYIRRTYTNSAKGVSPFEHTFLKEFRELSTGFLLVSIGMTLLSNTDIILVRHFFSDAVSGQYAALSLMGKAIFYFTTPVNLVFFPLIAQKKERKERLFNTVMLAFGFVALVSLSASFVYFAFPDLVLKIFFPGPQFHVLAQYLGIYSLFIFMFSIVTLFNSFFLSIGKTGIYKLMIIASIVQILLIFYIHHSLFQIIGIMFFVNAGLLASFLVYYLHHGKD